MQAFRRKIALWVLIFSFLNELTLSPVRAQSLVGASSKALNTAARAHIRSGDIEKAKSLLLKAGEGGEPELWAQLLDFKRAAYLSRKEAFFRMGNWKKGIIPKYSKELEGSPPKTRALRSLWLVVRQAIEYSVKAGELDEAEKNAEIFLQYREGLPLENREEIFHLAETMGWWWRSSVNRDEDQFDLRWQGIKEKLGNKRYTDSLFDRNLAGRLIEMNFLDLGEKYLGQAGGKKVGIPYSELGIKADEAGDLDDALAYYEKSMSQLSATHHRRDWCYHRRLILSATPPSRENLSDLVGKALETRFPPVEKGHYESNSIYPFATASLLKKMGALSDGLPNAIPDSEILVGLQRALPWVVKAEVTGLRNEDRSDQVALLLGLALEEYGDRGGAQRVARYGFEKRVRSAKPFLHHPEEATRLFYSSRMAGTYQLLAKTGLEEELMRTVFQLKGGVVDSVLNEKSLASKWPSGGRLLERLQEERDSLVRLQIDGSTNQGQLLSKEILIEGLFRKLNDGIAKIRVKSSRGDLESFENLQGILPANTAVVEYFFAPAPEEFSVLEGRYYATLVVRSQSPTLVDLGPSHLIDEHIRRVQGIVEEKPEKVEQSLRYLHDAIFAPLSREVGDQETWVFSPDGLLSFVPFSSLLSPTNTFLGEAVNIRLARAARSLLTPESTRPKTHEIEIFYRPEFGIDLGADTGGSERPVARSVSESMGDIVLSDLPGTEREAVEVGSILEQRGWKQTVHGGATATEANLRGAGSPQILHFATHGFFLPKIDIGNTRSIGNSGTGGDPLFQSGLFLAGSNLTLNAWNDGTGARRPPSENDGVVFAAELANLPMKGVDLVVLSACDTGLGTVHTGEGIMGLRRAFVHSGIRNSMVTLWEVDDLATVELIKNFYFWIDDHSYQEALQKAQVDLLRNYRKQHGIAVAVYLAGAFQIIGSDRSVFD